MATSPNYNWPEPDNTDLVKNGALAIRTAVNAIDTSLAELKGGTTGQVLSKTSATDMDFTWVTTDDANAIQNAIVDAKGDLIAASANDTPARLAVGANYGFLQADSTQSTGLLWNNAAWTSYTPTVTSGSGSITSYTSSAAYTRIGKLCVVRGLATITNAGTAGTFIGVSLPFTGASGIAAGHGSGREQALTGKMLEVYVQASLSSAYIWFYDGTFPGATGNALAFIVTYEVA